MIGIKKVEVVSLDNYGKIINSFNTTDDKTTNAPSINAVEEKLTDINSDISDINSDLTNLNNNAVVKGDFAVLTGSIVMPEANASSTQGTTTINLPTGFTGDNSAVISLMGRRTSLTTPYYTTPMHYENSQAQTLGAGGLFCRMGESDIMVGAFKSSTTQASYTINFRIVLMKIS